MRRFLTIAMLSLLTGLASATDYIYTNGTGNVSTPASWFGGVAPGAVSDTLKFPAVASNNNITVTADSAWSINPTVYALTFPATDNDVTNNGIITIAGTNTLNIGAGGISDFNDYAPVRIATPISFMGDGSIYEAGILWLTNGSMITASQPSTLTLKGHWNIVPASSLALAPSINLIGANVSIGTNITNLVVSGTINTYNGTNGFYQQRISSNTTITMNGGMINFGAFPTNASSGNALTNFLGPLVLNSGCCYESFNDTVPSTARLTYDYAMHSSFVAPTNPACVWQYSPVFNGSVNFVSTNGFPNHKGIMGGWAIYSSFAFLSPPSAPYGACGNYAGTSRTNSSDWMNSTATENVALTTNAYTLTSNLTNNSLQTKWTGVNAPVTLNLGGYTLTLDTGGIAMNTQASATNIWTNGFITAGPYSSTIYYTGNHQSTFSPSFAFADNGTNQVNVFYANNAYAPILNNVSNLYSGWTAIGENAGAGPMYTVSSFDPDPGGYGLFGKVPTNFVANNVQVYGGGLTWSGASTNRGIYVGDHGMQWGNTWLSNAVSGPGPVYFNNTPGITGTGANSWQGPTYIYIPGNPFTLNKPAGTVAIPTDIYVLLNGTASTSRNITWGASRQLGTNVVIHMYRPDDSGVGVLGLSMSGYSDTCAGLDATYYGQGTPANPMFLQNGSASAASTLQINPVAGATWRYSGQIINGSTKLLSIVINGPGTQEFSGNTNTFTGGIIVSNGTLLCNSTSDYATGGVIVASNGTVSGAGVLAGPLTIQAGGTYYMQPNFGYLKPARATLAGTLSIPLAYSIPDGGMIIMSSTGTITGTFSTLPSGTVAAYTSSNVVLKASSNSVIDTSILKVFFR